MEEGEAEPQRNDTPLPDASQPSSSQQPPPARRAGYIRMQNIQQPIPVTPSPCGKFIQYDVSGNIFEVTSKYTSLIKKIGKGGNGVVCSAVNSETNEKVAIKKIENPFENKVYAKRVLREIKLLQRLNHENVIAMKDVIPPRQREAFNDVYIVFELMETDLRKFMMIYKHLVSEENYQYFMYHMLRGLKYIHSASVLHRDIKPDNLLLDKDGVLKICDFGLSCVCSEPFLTYEKVATRWYRAPELLFHSNYNAAIDVWAVGCTFMEICTREPLFPGKDTADQRRLVLTMIGTPSEAEQSFLSEEGKELLQKEDVYQRQSFTEKFRDVDPQAIDLVEKMLTFDPRQRISVEDALAHPYLSTFHGVHDEPVCAGPIIFDFEQQELSLEGIKELIYQEALYMNLHEQSPENALMEKVSFGGEMVIPNIKQSEEVGNDIVAATPVAEEATNETEIPQNVAVVADPEVVLRSLNVLRDSFYVQVDDLSNSIVWMGGEMSREGQLSLEVERLSKEVEEERLNKLRLEMELEVYRLFLSHSLGR